MALIIWTCMNSYLFFAFLHRIDWLKLRSGEENDLYEDLYKIYDDEDDVFTWTGHKKRTKKINKKKKDKKSKKNKI